MVAVTSSADFSVRENQVSALNQLKKNTMKISDRLTSPTERGLTDIQLVRIELQKAFDYIKVQHAEMDQATIGKYQEGQRGSASSKLPKEQL